MRKKIRELEMACDGRFTVGPRANGGRLAPALLFSSARWETSCAGAG